MCKYRPPKFNSVRLGLIYMFVISVIDHFSFTQADKHMSKYIWVACRQNFKAYREEIHDNHWLACTKRTLNVDQHWGSI